MIDIHSHILPGLDDGSPDLYESLEMARLAVDSGISGIVATPHCNIPGVYRNYFTEELRETFRKTQDALKAEHIPIQLYPGAEVYVTPDIISLLRDGKILTINGSRYILVEFSFTEEPDYVEYMLEQLVQVGLQPVIAHPERYEFVQDYTHLVYEWRKKGYLVQVNKGSLNGRFGKTAYKTGHTLMKHQLVSVIASDAHRIYRRTPYMRDVYEDLKQNYSEQYLQMLFEENPKRICNRETTLPWKLIPF